MKNTIPIIIFFLISISWFSCKTSIEKGSGKDANIEFDTIAHDFGAIPFDGDADFEFVFKNEGKSPLLLTQVKSTCGCTIPEWSREPIGSGQQGVINVSYDSHRVGPFTKSIYVYSNASEGVIRLSITGKVLPVEKNESI